ncbi:ABC transporter substrate-binding protein [Trichothermofontia sp.]
MSQRSGPPPIVYIILFLMLLGGGVYWFFFRQSTPISLPGGGGPISLPGMGTGSSGPISTGNTVLVPEPTPAKQTGVAAMAAGNYAEAIQQFQQSLQQDQNDPEALIYLNNARIGTQPAYTIAVIAPLSQALNPAKELMRGVAQAQNQVNQTGGINGVPLKVAIADDGNTAEGAKRVAQALVRDSAIVGVVGHFGSEASLAAGPIYEAGQLVMISPTSTSVALSGVGNYVFRTVPSDKVTASALSRYQVNQIRQPKAAIFFNSQSDYSQSLKNEFSTALLLDGGEVVAEADLSAAGFNASAQLQQAVQQGAQVLVLLSNTATLDQALQVVQVNQRQRPLLGGDSLYNIKLLDIGGENAVGMVVAVPWHILANPNSPFTSAARQLWRADVNWRTAMAYDATQALIAALGQGNPSRSGVQQALAQSGFSTPGATGVIRFLPSGDRNAPVQLVRVAPGTRAGGRYEFAPISGPN